MRKRACVCVNKCQHIHTKYNSIRISKRSSSTFMLQNCIPQTGIDTNVVYVWAKGFRIRPDQSIHPGAHTHTHTLSIKYNLTSSAEKMLIIARLLSSLYVSVYMRVNTRGRFWVKKWQTAMRWLFKNSARTSFSIQEGLTHGWLHAYLCTTAGMLVTN